MLSCSTLSVRRCTSRVSSSTPPPPPQMLAAIQIKDTVQAWLMLAYLSAYAEQLQSQLLVATSKNACGVILDVRRNIGGMRLA